LETDKNNAAHENWVSRYFSSGMKLIDPMEPDALHNLAGRFQRGELPLEEFLQRLRGAMTADVGIAQVDIDRRRRCGFSEVVFGPGKSPQDIERIFQALLADGGGALATRIDDIQAAHLQAKFPTGIYNPRGRTFRVPPVEVSPAQPAGGRGRVAILTAGTSDAPVAEEARETALWMGVDVTMIHDVGVAGPQRLLASLETLRAADAIVVVAGMEGALPSVVGGHVACPVVAVPTSVGYGASFGGLAALLSMLNSCAANVTVVNIDAGFKGGYVAGMIARNLAQARHPQRP
jgi:NCAIR mutase (PurE)-related protein